MSGARKITWTEASYLAFERASEIKHEFIDGEVFDMAGASKEHNLIVGSSFAAFYNQLRKRPCNIYPSDMRIRVAKSGTYTYPDISIVCGESRFDDQEKDTLLNPTVLIEVISPTTEKYDRGAKFQHYRELDSLQEYLLISQDSVRIEHFVRQSDDEWRMRDTVSLDAVLTLPSIDCTLALADVYEKVDFDNPT